MASSNYTVLLGRHLPTGSICILNMAAILSSMLAVVAVCYCLSPCKAVLHAYIPVIQHNVGHRDNFILTYFHLGFSYVKILSFLVMSHGISLSIQQLKRTLRNQGLFRRRNLSDPREVINAVEQELRGSGCSLGYRLMHQRLRNDYGLIIDRETVRLTIKALDAEGVERRSRRRLKRRKYWARGPNYIWHIDGYDKLKPFGFCIQGAINGYSLRLLWLEASVTNNNPRVVARYFCNCVKQVGGVPRIDRDNGTENCNVAGIQRFFRRDGDDAFSGDKIFMYGRSISNQRIESWWSFLRKTDSDWWIQLFKDVRDSGIYCDDNPIHVECLKFCFMKLIQDELKRIAEHWNVHNIRPTLNCECPSGRPDVLYFLPEIMVTVDYSTPIPADKMDLAEEICCTGDYPQPASEPFVDLAHLIMSEKDLRMLEDAEEALSSYIDLVHFIEMIH